MLTETYYSNGTDQFSDGLFSSREWSAPSVVSPQEIREQLNAFSLCGRRVQYMRLINSGRCFTREWLEEAAYCHLEGLAEEERQRQSDYENIDTSLSFDRAVEIDEPLLIGFGDGEQFEIDTPQEPEFRMSLNSIPKAIKSKWRHENVDANLLFSPCIGQVISAVEIKTYTTQKEPMFGTPFEEPPYERTLVDFIEILFENGYRLKIGPQIDWCLVECLQPDGQCAKVSLAEILPGIKAE